MRGSTDAGASGCPSPPTLSPFEEDGEREKRAHGHPRRSRRHAGRPQAGADRLRAVRAAQAGLPRAAGRGAAVADRAAVPRLLPQAARPVRPDRGGDRPLPRELCRRRHVRRHRLRRRGRCARPIARRRLPAVRRHRQAALLRAADPGALRSRPALCRHPRPRARRHQRPQVRSHRPHRRQGRRAARGSHHDRRPRVRRRRRPRATAFAPSASPGATAAAPSSKPPVPPPSATRRQPWHLQPSRCCARRRPAGPTFNARHAAPPGSRPARSRRSWRSCAR